MSNTSEIGAFKVVSEGGVASGVRRIEAVAGQAAVEYLQSLDAIVKQLAGGLKVKGEDLPARIAALQVGCGVTEGGVCVRAQCGFCCWCGVDACDID